MHSNSFKLEEALQKQIEELIQNMMLTRHDQVATGQTYVTVHVRENEKFAYTATARRVMDWLKHSSCESIPQSLKGKIKGRANWHFGKLCANPSKDSYREVTSNVTAYHETDLKY